MITLHQLLKATVKQNATDLHLVNGSAPVMRVDGRMVRVKAQVLNGDDTRNLCYSVLTRAQKSKFEQTKELDFSFGVKNMARFRANIFFQRGAVSGVFRRIPLEIPSLSSLSMPSALDEIANAPNGLVLVTGPTGSGKTTTIASIIDKINTERRGHILTLEDPIEYIYEHKSCIINQREIGTDTDSYKDALRYVLRQDPDVCLVGELRDLETVETALTMAETGHLVFATLHTNSAIQTINRIVTMFEASKQERVRQQLSFVLNGIVCQRLVPRSQGGLVAASEILLMSPNIRNLIRENKLHQIYGMMQVGQNRSGMQTLNQSLFNLIIKRKVSVKDAFGESSDPDELDQMLKKAGV